MISSKNINIITIVLILMAFIFSIFLMYSFQAVETFGTIGLHSYSDKHSILFLDSDYYTNYVTSSPIKINFENDIATCKSKNVEIEENTITIMAGGTYVLSGDYNGKVVVDSQDEGIVRLVMNGVNIVSSDFSAIYVKNAKRVVISTIKGTTNSVSDSDVYDRTIFDDIKIDSAIYSKADLTINGSGTLIVNGNYSDGIKSNDGLKIMEGTLQINSVKVGIKANDYIAIVGDNVTINSKENAIELNEEDETKGFVVIENGNINISSYGDGISASSNIYINGGNMDISTKVMDNTETNMDNDISLKAIKADNGIEINGGTFSINSYDDSIHSNGDITVNGGTFSISTDDDAVHSDGILTLNNGDMTITKCYEGIEGKYIVVNGGTYSINSDDDSINACGDETMRFGGGPGMRESLSKTTTDVDMNYLTINGGKIYLETKGDGIDSNGSILMNGGYIEAYGPENGGNSTIDFETEFIINGGTVIGAGNSSMAESPSEKSTQNSITAIFSDYFEAGTTAELRDNNGNVILTSTPTKKYNWICFSSSDIVQGNTYDIYVDGESKYNLDVSSVVTGLGEKQNKFDGMQGDEMQRPMNDNGMGEDGDFKEKKEPPDFKEGEMPDMSNMPNKPDNAETSDKNDRPDVPGGKKFDSNFENKKFNLPESET